MSGTPFTRVSPVLAQAQPGYMAFRCPGCDDLHVLPTLDGRGQRWTYNGNPNKPTFYPSVLVRTGKGFDPHHPYEWEEGDPPLICHSFVTDGRIRFLEDSTHHLAGQVVDLPDVNV